MQQIGVRTREGVAAKSPQNSHPHMVPILPCHSHMTSHSHRESVTLCHSFIHDQSQMGSLSHRDIGVIHTVSLNFGDTKFKHPVVPKHF